MNKILFLDRDGVINQEIGNYITHPDAFELNPAIAPIISKAKELGYKVIVVTNQGGIGKGLYTHEILHTIHQKMIDGLGALDVSVDDIYYCPHHPDHDGHCLCRKPGSLMLEKVIAKYHADAAQSIMIGDTPRDMEAAAAVGVRGVLVEANELGSLAMELFGQ
ncbi:MAG: HAD family hydrolase [Flavobacteriaceae bacterium]|nr:HAD family hydrolase [Flavobacteriaceae bacterium]